MRVRMVAKGCGGNVFPYVHLVLPHIHLVRHDGIVHVVTYTEGPSVVTIDARGTPIADEFRVYMSCDRTVKMYLGGRNRITNMHPTCIRCLAQPAG